MKKQFACEYCDEVFDTPGGCLAHEAAVHVLPVGGIRILASGKSSAPAIVHVRASTPTQAECIYFEFELKHGQRRVAKTSVSMPGASVRTIEENGWLVWLPRLVELEKEDVPIDVPLEVPLDPVVEDCESSVLDAPGSVLDA